MEQLPASWALVPVSDVVRNITLSDKKIPQKKYLPSGKFPVFDQGQEYVGGYTDKAEMLVDCVLPVIVFGDHTRVVKLVNTVFAPGADGVKVLQPSACILPKLLEYFVRYLVTKIPNNGYARHYQHLAKSLLPIPPLAEQHRIVAKIEELFSELDQGVASLKTAREQLKVYRQSLLKNAFEGKLTAAWRAAHAAQLETAVALQQRIARERTERYLQQLADWQANGQQGPKPKPPKPLPPLIPEELAELPELPAGWFGGRLGLMTCGVEYGTAAKSAEHGACPVLRMGNIQNGKFDWGNLVFTDDAEEIAKYRLSEGDVLFNRTNSPELVGKSAVFKGARSALFAGYLIRVNQIPSIVLSDYLNYFLNSPIARQHGNTVKTDGVNQSNINGEKLVNYPFPFCGIEEQTYLVQELESKLSEADQLDQTLATALQQAEALRQSILKKAFCGQLVKQDPNDEPASALLERIRASRGASPAKGRQAKLGSKPLPNC